MANPPEAVKHGGSIRITIPVNICHELDLEPGEEVEAVEFDSQERAVKFEFSD